MTPNTDDFAFPGVNHAGVGTATATAPAGDFLTSDEPAAPVNIFDVRPDATRGLFFAGDILTPTHKRQRPDLKHGGEYLGQNFKTLFKSKFIVFRGQFTPMMVAYDVTPQDLLSEAQIQTSNVVAYPDGSVRSGVAVYPGHEINSILRADGDQMPKGIVEITNLREQDLPVFRETQVFFFPDWAEIVGGAKRLPTLISEFRRMIEARRAATFDAPIREIADQMLESVEQYRLWAIDYVRTNREQVVRSRNVGAQTIRYSELAEMLQNQLDPLDLTIIDEDVIAEASRERERLTAAAAQTTPPPVDSGVSDAKYAELLERQTIAMERQNEINERLLNNNLMPVSSPVLPQIPVPTATATEATPARCEGTNSKNEPCRANAVKGTTRCPSHQLETIESAE